MNIFRTHTLVLAATSVFVLSQGSAYAQAPYPNRPIKLIVPYAAGGTVDVFARIVTPSLEAKLKQPVVVDNVPGAGGAIGVNKGVKSTADGYTIVMGIVSDVVLAPLTESAVTYTYKELEAIAPLGTSGLAVVAKPSLGINSFSSLISYAKANPGKLSYGATGAGSLPALAMESLKQRTNVNIEFIPYASASKIALDLMGGHLDIALSGLPALLEPIKSGKMTPIGVMSKDRDIGAPEIGAAGETPELAGMDFYFWTGLFAPKGTPADIVSKINQASAEVLTEEKVRAKFKDYGVKISQPMTPSQFTSFVAKSNSDWTAVVTQSGLKKK